MAQAKGRAAPPEKLDLFTFQDTGRQVQIRKLSTLMRAEVRRQAEKEIPKPQPPMTEVDYGDGKVRRPHKMHPVYLELMAEWDEQVSQQAGARIRTIAIQRGVVAEVDEEAVKQVRAELEAIGTSTSQYDDHYVYVAFVCIGSEDDWLELLKAVYERAAPSEGAIQAQIATFQGDVQGPGSVESEP